MCISEGTLNDIKYSRKMELQGNSRRQRRQRKTRRRGRHAFEAVVSTTSPSACDLIRSQQNHGVRQTRGVNGIKLCQELARDTVVFAKQIQRPDRCRGLSCAHIYIYIYIYICIECVILTIVMILRFTVFRILVIAGIAATITGKVSGAK